MTDIATQDQVFDAADAGKIEVLTIDELNVDGTYQRELDPGLVNRIAQHWDMAAAGPIVVSRRHDGSMWIVNGQHRAAGAKQAGETEILAQVVHGLDRAGEALLRLKGNTRRGDTAMERFRAQVASENPESLAIVELCERFETRINYRPNEHKGINSVSAVEDLFRRDDGVLLTRVLEVIQDAWGEVGGKNVSVHSLKGIAWFLERHSAEANRERLVDRMRSAGRDEIERKARSHKAAQGGAMWVNTYRALVEEYNHRLPDSKRLLWRLSGARGG